MKSRIKFISPPLLMKQKITANKYKNPNRFGKRSISKIESQRHILFAGCSEDSYSNEAFLAGDYRGVFTSVFLKYATRYSLTWRELEKNVSFSIKKKGFDQVPQLVTMSSNLDKNIFT